MASVQGASVIPVEGLDDDEDESLDDEEEEEEVNDRVVVVADEANNVSPSTSFTGAPSPVTVAVYGAGLPIGKSMTSTSTNATKIVTASSDLKIQSRSTLIPDFQVEKKPIDDSRKLFQKLWTDEDEIELLRGFLDYTTLRGTTQHHTNDTALFHDQIKSKFQSDFNKNQLVEKLRRLKRKYRNVLSRITSGKEVNFKSPHDQATFQISYKIWKNSGRVNLDDALDDEEHNPISNPNNIDARKDEILGNGMEKMTGITPKSCKRPRSRLGMGMDETVRDQDFPTITPLSIQNPNSDKNSGYNDSNITNFSRLIEETVRSCLSPAVKELCNSMGGPCGSGGIFGLATTPIPIAYGRETINFENGREMIDERWRKQQILELEVYSKRLELVQDQIKLTLEELRSKEGRP